MATSTSKKVVNQSASERASGEFATQISNGHEGRRVGGWRCRRGGG